MIVPGNDQLLHDHSSYLTYSNNKFRVTSDYQQVNMVLHLKISKFNHQSLARKVKFVLFLVSVLLELNLW